MINMLIGNAGCRMTMKIIKVLPPNQQAWFESGTSMLLLRFVAEVCEKGGVRMEGGLMHGRNFRDASKSPRRCRC